MTDEGSPEGNSALAQLSTSLNIEQTQLKIALQEAFGLLQRNENASLSLQIILARMGYQIDGAVFYSTLSNFRRAFANVFADVPVAVASVPIPQMALHPFSNNPYQFLEPNPPAENAPPSRNADAIMTLPSDHHDNLEASSQTAANTDIKDPSNGSDEPAGSPNISLHQQPPATDPSISSYAQGEVWHHGLVPSPYNSGNIAE